MISNNDNNDDYKILDLIKNNKYKQSFSIDCVNCIESNIIFQNYEELYDYIINNCTFNGQYYTFSIYKIANTKIDKQKYKMTFCIRSIQELVKYISEKYLIYFV